MNHLIEKHSKIPAKERRIQLERIARNAPAKSSPATLDTKAQMQLPGLLKPAPDLQLPVLERLVLKAVRAVRSDYLRRYAGSRKGRLSGEMRVLESEPWIDCVAQLKALDRSSGDFAQAVRGLTIRSRTWLSRAGASWEYLETLDARLCRHLLRLQRHAASAIENIAPMVPEKPTHRSVKNPDRLFYTNMEFVYFLATGMKATAGTNEVKGEDDMTDYSGDWMNVLEHAARGLDGLPPTQHGLRRGWRAAVKPMET